MHNKEIETYCPKSQTDWRHWLKKNHKSKQSVWLIYHTKKSNVPSLSWSEAVDEALCFGWIDSTRKKINDISFMQFFSKRKPKSNWSKINKEKVQQLIDSKRMTKQGYESVEIAKQNGYWTILDEIEEVIIPEDLEIAFKKYNGSKDYFLSLSKSTRKIILSWIILVGKQETRQKRIEEVVESAALNLKPKHLR
ncbi:YdeI/OmpD-associated family protein [Elizabethkingia anophelis]|nr:YdeI/OmpD-associated family protein [Elizabethkingia anophelis]MCT3957822.1 YdeI/OmpD-associated family protein [Elizabethkingia anophelis]MCT4061024.1 YdeI/OmpD-associated family protein [Elizabethkingia anophelis]MCT4107316.1 YdeI/OmpD-associated family protein [Elizabethkingia anophelis]